MRYIRQIRNMMYQRPLLRRGLSASMATSLPFRATLSARSVPDKIAQPDGAFPEATPPAREMAVTAVPRRLADDGQRRIRRHEGSDHARQFRMPLRIVHDRHAGRRAQQKLRRHAGDAAELRQPGMKIAKDDVVKEVHRVGRSLVAHRAIVEHDLLAGVQTVDEGEIDIAAELDIDDACDVLRRNPLKRAHWQLMTLGDAVGKRQAIAHGLIGRHVERRHLAAGQEQAECQRAPAHRIADDQRALRMIGGEDVLEEIDFLHRDAEIARHALAVAAEPGKRRPRQTVGVIRRHAGAELDALLAIEFGEHSDDRHGGRKAWPPRHAKIFRVPWPFLPTSLLIRRMAPSSLETRLRRALKGDVLFDDFSRGRYSTDASIYQIEPIGVVVPRDVEDVTAAFAIAREEGLALLPRGGRTLVLDCSKYMNRIVSLDAEKRRARVQPGLVLDRLNRGLKAKGLFFPVDISTADRAPLGGMAANNSCGARSLRYGNMVHNVRAIGALLVDGTRADSAHVVHHVAVA